MKQTFSFAVALLAMLSTVTYAKNATRTVTDIDGNHYRIVRIGKQVWLAENLRVTKYRDGSPIPLVADPDIWEKTDTGARCRYENDPTNEATYAQLYNFFAVADGRGLCPVGWHVPTDTEWRQLTDTLGGERSAGGQLKATSHWLDDKGATNASGFAALPGGCRDIHIGNKQKYDWLGLRGWFWSSTHWGRGYSWARIINNINTIVDRQHPNGHNGFSVRCLKD